MINLLLDWLIIFGVCAIPGWVVGHFIPRSFLICLILTEAFTLFWTFVLWLFVGATLAVVMGNPLMLKMGVGFNVVIIGQIIFFVPILLSILLGFYIFRRAKRVEPHQAPSISVNHAPPLETN